MTRLILLLVILMFTLSPVVLAATETPDTAKATFAVT